MKIKSEFIAIKPKTEEAQEFFDIFMKQLHSCRVLQRENNKVLLNPITGNYKFWLSLVEDKNWEVIK